MQELQRAWNVRSIDNVDAARLRWPLATPVIVVGVTNIGSRSKRPTMPGAATGGHGWRYRRCGHHDGRRGSVAAGLTSSCVTVDVEAADAPQRGRGAIILRFVDGFAVYAPNGSAIASPDAHAAWWSTADGANTNTTSSGSSSTGTIVAIVQVVVMVHVKHRRSRRDACRPAQPAATPGYYGRRGYPAAGSAAIQRGAAPGVPSSQS